MQQYFVDTRYLVALFDRTDQHHSRAQSGARRHALTNDHHFQQEGFVVVNE